MSENKLLKRKSFLISIGLVALYLLAGFFAGPGWLQPVLESYVAKQTGRELQFEQLRVDPITLSFKLSTVTLAQANGALWPGVSLSADVIAVRLNFWKFHPAVAELIIERPLLVIDAANADLKDGHYPFIALLEQWHSAQTFPATDQAVEWQKLHVLAGGLEVRSAVDSNVAEAKLKDWNLQAERVDKTGSRAWQLALNTHAGTALLASGSWDGVQRLGSGDYEWRFSTESQTELNYSKDAFVFDVPNGLMAGKFSLRLKQDPAVLLLEDSRFSAQSMTACLFAVLCVESLPNALSSAFGKQVDVNAELSLGTDGISFRSAKLQTNAIELISYLQTASGRMDAAGAIAVNELNLELSKKRPLGDQPITVRSEWTTDEHGRVKLSGLLEPSRTRADWHVSLQGDVPFEADFELENVPAEQDQPAASNIQMSLSNPEAGLAGALVAKHLQSELEASAALIDLHLDIGEQLQVSGGLISLVDANLAGGSSNSRPDDAPEIGMDTLPTDAEWLLALLQNAAGDALIRLQNTTLQAGSGQRLVDEFEIMLVKQLEEMRVEPMAALISQAGSGEIIPGEVIFEAGSAALEFTMLQRIQQLAGLMIQRPLLGLSVDAVYDPLIDLKELQTEQIRTHIALASASELSFQSGSEPTDFSDPVVHSVMDEFARRRLPASVLQAFATHFGLADVDQGVLPEGDAEEYYTALFEVLVEYADIPQGALSTLARYRAQAVMDVLVKQGVESDHLLGSGTPQQVEARMGGVPLSFNLDVIRSSFDNDEADELSEKLLNELKSEKKQ